MNDRTVTRASRRGTHTVPIEARSKRIRSDTKLYPDEIALAVDMARADRIERDIEAYAHKKKAASAPALTA